MPDPIKKAVENALTITIIGTALMFAFGPGVIHWFVDSMRAAGY